MALFLFNKFKFMSPKNITLSFGLILLSNTKVISDKNASVFRFGGRYAAKAFVI